VMLIGCTNMTTLFLGIETLSIPMYVLAASKKNDTKSNEAGFKYLIMGSFASGFLLFGIALIYGATTSFDLMEISLYTSAVTNAPAFFYVGVIMILVSMAFKIAVAPFHFWAPDVYEGSPVLITALMSTVVKTAAFAAFARLFMLCFADVNEIWLTVLAAFVALSLIVSNFTAVLQTNTKRMLAYSSISHAAFMLMIIMSDKGDLVYMNTLVYYTVAYSLASLTAFASVYIVSKNGSEETSELNGLNKRNKFLTLCFTIALLSLAGIPVTAGFFAKYFVLSHIPSDTMLWLTILAVISSSVAAFYYLKIVGHMYFGVGRTEEPIVVQKSFAAVLIICVILLFVLGMIPGLITELTLF
jgi:NADH-quinone oxidoreductase subunit N